jgi:hypothetical protein
VVRCQEQIHIHGFLIILAIITRLTRQIFDLFGAHADTVDIPTLDISGHTLEYVIDECRLSGTGRSRDIQTGLVLFTLARNEVGNCFTFRFPPVECDSRCRRRGCTKEGTSLRIKSDSKWIDVSIISGFRGGYWRSSELEVAQLDDRSRLGACELTTKGGC